MLSDIKNENKSLNLNEATTHDDIPPKILRYYDKLLKSLETLVVTI